MKKYQNWFSHINKHRIPILRQIKNFHKLEGVGLEIGAGTCWLSSLLSKRKKIKSLYAIDNKLKKLNLARNIFIPKYKGKMEKIHLVTDDFHHLPFKENTFDFIVCDAALHHSHNLKLLLLELNRVLKKTAPLIAIREPILPSFPLLKKFRSLTFGYKEKLKGEIENSYTFSQWKTSFYQSGFSLRRNSYFLNTSAKEKIIKNIYHFNGILFSRYYLTAKKVKNITPKKKTN